MGEIIFSIVVGSTLIVSGIFMLLVLGKEEKIIRRDIKEKKNDE